MLIGVGTERRGRLVRVVAAVVDAVAQQIGRYAEILLGASKIAANQLGCARPKNEKNDNDKVV